MSFVDRESFLESNSPDILTLYETFRVQLILAISSFNLKGLSSFNLKGFCYSYTGKDFLLHGTYHYHVLKCLYFIKCHTSFSTVFDAISCNIEKGVSLNQPIC